MNKPLFPNITGTVATGDPRMRFNIKQQRLVVSSYSRESGKYENRTVKEHVLVDFGSARHGWERLKKGKPYSLILVPITENVPDAPDDDYVAVGGIAAIVPCIGRVEWIVDNETVSHRLSELFERYETDAIAASGKIPVVMIDNTDWEIYKWEDRKEQFLGPRLVPVPTMEIESDG